jgi:hypothetical protein
VAVAPPGEVAVVVDAVAAGAAAEGVNGHDAVTDSNRPSRNST